MIPRCPRPHLAACQARLFIYGCRHHPPFSSIITSTSAHDPLAPVGGQIPPFSDICGSACWPTCACNPQAWQHDKARTSQLYESGLTEICKLEAQVIVNLLDEPGKLMPMMSSLRRLSAISTASSGLDLSVEDLGSPNLIDLLGPSTSVSPPVSCHSEALQARDLLATTFNRGLTGAL